MLLSWNVLWTESQSRSGSNSSFGPKKMKVKDIRLHTGCPVKNTTLAKEMKHLIGSTVSFTDAATLMIQMIHCECTPKLPVLPYFKRLYQTTMHRIVPTHIVCRYASVNLTHPEYTHTSVGHKSNLFLISVTKCWLETRNYGGRLGPNTTSSLSNNSSNRRGRFFS